MLLKHIKKAVSLDRSEVYSSNSIIERSFDPDNYVLMTLHRPSNVDDPEALKRITDWVKNTLSKSISVIWVIHPRTENQLKKLSLWEKLISTENMLFLYPLDYHHMLKLSSESDLIITDSGGLQEEATVLKKPCLVIRPNTERPITLVSNGGSCILVDNHEGSLNEALARVRSNKIHPQTPLRWDGKASERCLEAILSSDSIANDG